MVQMYVAVTVSLFLSLLQLVQCRSDSDRNNVLEKDTTKPRSRLRTRDVSNKATTYNDDNNRNKILQNIANDQVNEHAQLEDKEWWSRLLNVGWNPYSEQNSMSLQSEQDDVTNFVQINDNSQLFWTETYSEQGSSTNGDNTNNDEAGSDHANLNQNIWTQLSVDSQRDTTDTSSPLNDPVNYTDFTPLITSLQSPTTVSSTESLSTTSPLLENNDNNTDAPLLISTSTLSSAPESDSMSVSGNLGFVQPFQKLFDKAKVNNTDDMEASIGASSTAQQNNDRLVIELCKATVAERQAWIVMHLNALHADSISNFNVDDPKVLSSARDWIIRKDMSPICNSDDNIFRLYQRYSAVVFYYSTAGDTWVKQSHYVCDTNVSSDGECVTGEPWLSATDECKWYGIECDDIDGTITYLKLSGNDLQGIIPETIYHGWPSVKGISLDDNLLTSRISEAVGKWKMLEYIDIDNNKLSGTIPQSLWSLTRLQAIDLDHNKLTGTIPSSISQLTNLVLIQLDNNLLTGTLPTESMTSDILPSMVQIRIHNNSMIGSLETMCQQVPDRQASYPAYLQFFSSDCSGSEMECSCCSQCY